MKRQDLLVMMRFAFMVFDWFLMVSSASARLVVDQENDVPTGTTVSCGTPSSGSILQTFVPTVSALDAVRLRLEIGGGFPPSAYTTRVVIRSGAEYGPQLGEATALIPKPQGAGGVVDVYFYFTPSVALVPGQTYAIEWFSCPEGGQVMTWFCTDDTYPHGMMVSHCDPYAYTPVPWWDMVFATYMGRETSLASEPRPADGSTAGAGEAVVLSWTPGDDAVRHDVYLATGRAMVEQASSRDVRGAYRGRQSAATYRVPSGELVLGQTYYWRIDEVDKANAVHRGTVWSFATTGFILVDDFEKYTDEIGGCIFETWIDGMGFTKPAPGNAGNGTGSVVGNRNPPYAETTIVHSGKQSMPLGYDNSKSPFYSEAERTFNPPGDWTRFDVNMVTVYIRGDPANNPGTLYMEAEDSDQHSKLVSSVDPQAVTKGYWKRWDIPLSEFAAGGVNLTRVERIVIGIGDQTAAKAGGKGKVYIDDIRLRKVGGTLRPVAHWEFEEGSGNKAADSAGLNDGTVIGAQWVPGKIGQALRFDGFDDYVDCGSDGALNPAELTVALWVCPETVYAMAQSLVAKVGSGTYDVDYSLQIGMMGVVKGVFSDGSANVVVSGAKNLTTGEWTHLALTRDGSEMALYMNGGSRTSVGYSVPPVNGGYPLRIGGPRAYQGKIDDVRIYDQALAPEQIEQIAGGQM